MAQVVLFLRCKLCREQITLPDSTITNSSQSLRRLPKENWKEWLLCAFCCMGFTARGSDVQTLLPGGSRPYLRPIEGYYRVSIKCGVLICKARCEVLMPIHRYLPDDDKVERLDKFLNWQSKRPSDPTNLDPITCTAGHKVEAGVSLSSISDVYSLFDD